MFLSLRLLFIYLLFANQAYSSEHITWLWDADTPPANSHSVALLTEHIWLKGHQVLRRPRQVMPHFAPHIKVTPLVHIEYDIQHPPPPPEQFRTLLIRAVVQAASYSTSGWVQLDYEARPSHKLFYKQLVKEIKAALPPDIKLSVTALAWWCQSPDWLNDLAADEVVPMFFRMGKQPVQATQALHPRCREQAIGLAVQEPLNNAPNYGKLSWSKVYWFNYTRWSNTSAWPPANL